MFEGKKNCPSCQTPQSPSGFGGGEVCLACQGKLLLAVANKKVASRGSDVLTEQLASLRDKEAATPAAAEAFLAEIGGADAFGRNMAQDFKRIRGDNLTKEQRAVHVVNDGALTKYYGLAAKMNADRDAMVADAEPMADLNSDDLNAIVSEGAIARLEHDPDFRLMIISEILLVEPEIMERLVAYSPSVEVVNA